MRASYPLPPCFLVTASKNSWKSYLSPLANAKELRCTWNGKCEPKHTKIRPKTAQTKVRTLQLHHPASRARNTFLKRGVWTSAAKLTKTKPKERNAFRKRSVQLSRLRYCAGLRDTNI